MANVPVDFDKLVENHPDFNAIGQLVNVPSGIETCTVQMSYALNHAGSPITNYEYQDPTLPYDKKTKTNHVRGYRAADNRTYLFSVPDMKVYLNRTYGSAENKRGSRANMEGLIQNRTGILAFGHRHIDLWLGDDIHRPHLYKMGYLWNNESINLRGIFFWEVTSQWGF